MVSEALTMGRATQQQEGPWGMWMRRTTGLHLPSFPNFRITATSHLSSTQSWYNITSLKLLLVSRLTEQRSPGIC